MSAGNPDQKVYVMLFFFPEYRRVSRYTPPKLAPSQPKGGCGRGLSQLKLLSGGYRAIRGIAEIVSPITV